MQDMAELGIVVNNTQIRAAGSELDKLGSKGMGVASMLKTAFAGVSAAFAMRYILQQITEAQDATAQLEAAVRSTGGAARLTVPELQAMASSLQRVTTFSDEAVMGAQSILLTFRAIKGVQFNEATAAITNLATRMGGDLRGAALQVGKALQDPTQGLTALRRSGVSFSDAQIEVIKNLQATNQLAKAQTIILKELEVEFGGSAAAARNTLGGALAGLKNDFGELFEVSAKGTSVFVLGINAMAAALRELKPALDILMTPVNVIRTAFEGLGALSDALAVGFLQMAQRVQGALGGLVRTFGTAIEALGGTALGQRLQATGDAMVLEAARIQARLALEFDASLIDRFNRSTGRTAGSFGGGRLPPPPDETGPSPAEIARAKEARDVIARLKEEADTFGMTASQARLYAIEISKMTEAEKALARAQSERLRVMQEVVRVMDNARLGGDRTRTGASVEEQWAGVNAANGPNTFQMFNTPGASPMREAAADSEDIKDAWADTARSAVQLVQAMGGANDSTLLMLHNLVSVVDQAEQLAAKIKLLKAGESLAAGDFLGLLASAAGLLSSVFGGGESPEARRAREITQQNTEAIRANTDAQRQALTGTAFAGARSATGALLGAPTDAFRTMMNGYLQDLGRNFLVPAVNDFLAATGNQTLRELQDFAKTLGITLNTDSTTAFIDSLRALDERLKQTEFVKFANTFAGRMQMLSAQWRVFDTTDPLQKLTEQLAEAGRAGTGSSAFNLAGRGPNLINWRGGVPTVIPGQQLDLATSAGRNALLGNLQTLFLQLQQGTLGTAQMGGMNAQEFLDQLTGMIDLIRQAEEAATANNEALQRVADTLRAFNDSLQLSDLSPLSPVQKLSEAQRQYQDLLAKAQGGDLAAAAQLPEAARAFLDASRAVNASGPAFAADFARVTADLAGLADLFEGQMDVATATRDYTAVIVGHTANTVTQLEAVVATLSAGLTAAVDELSNLRAESAAASKKTQQAIEALAL